MHRHGTFLIPTGLPRNEPLIGSRCGDTREAPPASQTHAQMRGSNRWRDATPTRVEADATGARCHPLVPPKRSEQPGGDRSYQHLGISPVPGVGPIGREIGPARVVASREIGERARGVACPL